MRERAARFKVAGRRTGRTLVTKDWAGTSPRATLRTQMVQQQYLPPSVATLVVRTQLSSIEDL